MAFSMSANAAALLTSSRALTFWIWVFARHAKHVLPHRSLKSPVCSCASTTVARFSGRKLCR
jgi:hypothetical protein